MEEKEEENSRVVTQDKEQHEPPNQPGAAGDSQAAALPLLPLAELRHLDFDLNQLIAWSPRIAVPVLSPAEKTPLCHAR